MNAVVKSKKKGKKRAKETKPESEKPTETTEQEAAKPQVVDISALPVWQILPFFIHILDSVAWQKMGLVVNPMTQEIQKDLNQARVAIDLYEALLNQLGEQVDADTKTALKSRLADLKLNFATHS